MIGLQPHGNCFTIDGQMTTAGFDAARESGLGPDAYIVIGPDGTVLAATGDLQPGLVDARLEDCDGLSRTIRDAAQELLHRLRRTGLRVLVRGVALDGGRRVQLVAIEALVIRRTATDLRTLLASKLAVISSQAAAAGVTLTVTVADNVPALVHVDSEKVAWAATTLVGNALRYVRAGTRKTPAGTIAVRAAFDPLSFQVILEVQDDGPGIPPDTVARLFRRDGLNVRGAGLALLLMSDICAAHGGSVDVRSSIQASDHGTTVRLVFPSRDVA
jgi:signal transduction histidine kinase